MLLRALLRAACLSHLAVLMLTCSASAESARTGVPVSAASFDREVVPLIGKYCTRCHGGVKPKGGLNLASYTNEAAVSRNRKVWRRVAEYLEAGDMPPDGQPKPQPQELALLSGWITGRLTKAECGQESDPGQITLRRLNRAEYNNTVRDLFGIDFRLADDFPSDDVGYGFDNIGDVLTLPPLLMEKYLAAAETIAEQAIVTSRSGKGLTKTWEVEDLSDEVGGGRFEDLGRTLASSGEIAVPFTFTRDGEYILRARAFGQQAGPEKVRMGFLIDRKPLKMFEVAVERDKPKVYELKVKLRAGLRNFSVSFLNDFYDPNAADRNHRDRNLVIDYLEIQGPVGSASGPLPESHRRIIFCKPTKETKLECSRAILERFASRAYRRPATAGEVGRLMKFVDLAEQNGDSFEGGVQLAVEAVLCSSQFLFRVELDPKRSRRDRTVPSITHPINDFELASRLSYFLWSSTPDEELFQLALNGKLREGDNLEKQVRRLLRDPKSKALVENFAGQWLQIRNLKTASPDHGRFPNFDEPLRMAMEKETELFFEAMIREDRSVLDLLDTDFTFLNERLAKHYGINGIKGERFRRVTLRPGEHRGGLLTQASILTVTSNPTRTSPVKRGKWILEQILGAPPPPPPPDVPELKDEGATLTGTLRQRMEQHRANPSCASCHARLDPLGFGLENFDAIGAWREKDGPAPIDSSGVLPSGQSFRGPFELKAVLRERSPEFTRCLVEKLMTYALGRGIEETDTCSVDQIVEAVAKDRSRFSRLVVEIVKSPPFQRRRNRGSGS